jgi:hypothetical protein
MKVTRMTTLLRLKTDRFGLLAVVFFVLVFSTTPRMAQTRCGPTMVYTPDIEIKRAQLMSFQPPRHQWIVTRPEGRRQIEYGEALVLRVELVDSAQVCALPSAASPELYIGPFRHFIRAHGVSGPGIPLFDYHLTHWEQLEEETPIILTYWPEGPWREPAAFREINFPRFRHDMIVDKRWTVFGGFVEDLASFKFRKNLTVSHTTVKVSGGAISLSTVPYKSGWFNLNYPEGIKLEEGESYTVEVLVNKVVLFSKTITRETADYPKWELNLEPQESMFYEIKGHVYDAAGVPIPEVTLTLDEHHSATTDENGYFRFVSLFAGTYTLTASKEGYSFKPVEITGGQGKPVNIDLVESSPTRCLLYAVHDTAKDEGQLFTVDLSKEPFEVKPLNLTPPSHEVSVAVADFDGDDEDEIALAAKQGGHTVTLYELDGTVIRSFPVQASGLSLAAGEIDGDDKPEILVASRAANRDSVFVYAADGTAKGSVALFDKNTRLAPAVGDIDGDDKADILAGRLLKEDQVAVYNSAALSHFSVFQSRTRKKADKPGKATGPHYGVNVASDDFNEDGKADIVAAMASKGSQVEVYGSDGTLLKALTAFDSRDGVVVAAGNVIDDGQPEIIVGEAKGPLIRGFNLAGEQRFELKAVTHGTVSSMALFRCP